jgi:hypothetical protein
MFLLLLAAILAVAAIWVNFQPQEAPRPVNLVSVAVAQQDIAPYSIVAPGQAVLGPAEIPDTVAVDYYENTSELLGYMTTRFIKAGQRIGREDAKPIDQVRYVEDMALEVVSFPAVFSELVAGQVRPGQRINIYGYREETGSGNPGDAVLVASNVWVVDVRTSTGEEVLDRPADDQVDTGGLFTSPGLATFAQPASVVAVAAEPAVVRDIIFAFGAKGYSAWVTLAPSPSNIPPTVSFATPTPTPTRVPTPEPTTAPVQTPGAQPTPVATVTSPSSLTGAIYMSNRDAGPKIDAFPNNTSVVWVIANLQYTPDGPLPVRLDVRDRDDRLYFDGTFTHARSGQQSYLVVPLEGFSPDTEYTTRFYASDELLSVGWQLHGNSQLPNTGGDDGDRSATS